MACGGNCAADCVSDCRDGIRAKAGRGASSCPSRQPGEHVHPGGSDDLDRRADDGGVQQSRNVRSACAAEHIAVDRAGPRHRLVVERGRHGIDLSAARRRAAIYRKGCPVHLGHAARQVGCQVPHQPAQIVVLEPRSGHHQRRSRGDLSSEATATGPDRASRFRIFAGLSLPRAAAGHASAPDRHWPVQIRLV